MKYLSDRELLTIWEFGTKHSVIETSLFLLSYAYPEHDIPHIAAFSIGERDARLLHLRESLFGPVLQNTSDCTVCHQKMEWETSIDSLKLQPISETVPGLMDLNYKEHHIELRLPNSLDILELNEQDSEDDQVSQLIEQCVVNSTLPQKQAKKMSKTLKHKIVQIMEDHDPQANVVMKLSCSECGNQWEATFDILQYLLKEINDWAIEMLQDVYTLAVNFGWSESDILDMSRFRRNLYLNMING